MKNLLVIICLSTTFLAQAKTGQRFDYSYPNSQFKIAEENLQTKSFEATKKIDLLEKIKYLIVRGNLDYAKVLLKEADISTDFTKATQLRYLAIIYFVEGNYKLALDTVSRKELKSFQAEPRVCFIKVLSLMITERTNEATNAWQTCYDATVSYSPTNLLWMRILVDLKTTSNKNYVEDIFKEISVENLDKNYLRIYLKLALYLNKQDKVIPRFKFFSEEVLNDTSLRELIGFNYFRAGDVQMAYNTIESLNTANSETFKGNLYSFQGQYNQAYAQYKLALQLKNNSQNAIDRLIPLSWMLGQYKEGVNFLQKNLVSQDNLVQQNTLLAAFLTMNEKHQSSAQILDRIIEYTNRGEPLEVSQLLVYNAYSLGDQDKIELFSANSCEKYDGLNCWVKSLYYNWPNALDITKKQEKIHPTNSFQQEKLVQLKFNSEIKESNPVDQKKIEELDNNLINLLPQF